MQRRTFLKTGALAIGGAMAGSAGRLARAAATARLSILFCSPQGVDGDWGWIDLEYLRELHAQGLEVDYTNNLDEITWDRIRHYNVLLLYATPDGWAVGMRGQPSSPARIKRFVALMERYLAAGGGVFLMPMEMAQTKLFLSDLTDRWGARLTEEYIVETDPANVGYLVHDPYHDPLAYTDQVAATPVSAGVKGIWYPTQQHYNAAMGGPIVVDHHWQVVVQAMPSAETKLVDLKHTSTPPPEHPFQPPSVRAPALFAIRVYRQGRIALVNQWQQFSIGSGVKWLYDRQVLARGFGGKKSDFGRLLENTWRWLAEPSLKSKNVGGYMTGAQTLVAPNLRPGAATGVPDYNTAYWRGLRRQWRHPTPPNPIYRGLIGAKTSYSSGRGTVAEYAVAAKEAGLHFLIFLEDFDKLSREKWARLIADCRRHSDAQMLILPGYTMDSNIGDHLFFYYDALARAPQAAHDYWPPANCLTGPNKSQLYLQRQDAQGRYVGGSSNLPAAMWMLSFGGSVAVHDAMYGGDVSYGNAGYYHFTATPHQRRISDLCAYAVVAIRYYRDGRLVEDRTEDYLTTTAATSGPVPVSLNEVRSPTELKREVELGHSLTHVQARSISQIYNEGLWWANPFVSLNTFPSDGPIIHAWPRPWTLRVATLGAEEFVTLAGLLVAPIEVSAAAGLEEVAIYNGPELFRRFKCHGAKRFRETLLLDGTIQRNMVLVAADQKGGKAVSFNNRCWKDGTRAVWFCADDADDCKNGGQSGNGMLLKKQSTPGLVTWVQFLAPDTAGWTWDGGPVASLPLATFEESRPVLETDQGREDGSRFENTPLVDYSDGGSVAVISRQDRIFSPAVEWVGLVYDTFGPLGGASKLMNFILRYWEYYTPSVGVPETGFAMDAVREGINACLFRSDICFKKAGTIKRLQILNNQTPLLAKPAYLVFGEAPAKVTRVVKYSDPKQQGLMRLAPGNWFALYSPATACSHIFFVRRQPVQLWFGNAEALVIHADIAGKQVNAGDTYSFELASLGVMVNIGFKSQADVTRLLTYLDQPEGLKILRGQRVTSPGFIECVAENGAVEVGVPKPSWTTNLTLPLRVTGLNRRWSAGLFQKDGYVLGHYGTGQNRYRGLGVDEFGCAYVPMYVDRAKVTHMVAGHPIVADEAGQDLFIGVVHLRDKPSQWHVSVNNPTDKPITSTLHKAMDVPGLVFSGAAVTMQPGEYRVLE